MKMLYRVTSKIYRDINRGMGRRKNLTRKRRTRSRKSITKTAYIYHKNIKRKVGGEINEKDCKYVSSRGILKSCDVYPPDMGSSRKNAPLEIDTIRDGSIVYVHGSAIPDLVNKIDKIDKKFVLVSGDCDESIPDAVFPSVEAFENFINSPKIIHWFSQNAVRKHEKLTGIPIGLDYHTISQGHSNWGQQESPVEQENQLNTLKDGAKPFSEREIKNICYSNFHFSPQKNRYNAMNKVSKDLVFYEPLKTVRNESWKKQVNFSFVLSPHGNGLDCHRTWEALCLGCIPIVKTSPIDHVFDELPVLIVNDWSDVTKELLEKTLKDFGQKKFNYHRLTLAYWMELIRSKKGAIGGGRVRMYSRKRSTNVNKHNNRTRNRKSGVLIGGDTGAVDGSLKKAVVYILDAKGGFFAEYFTLLRAYLYAKKLNIPFYVDHDKWHYTFKDGWHDYFKTLNILNKDEKFDNIERFEVGDTNDVTKEFTVADFLEGSKEIFILKDHIQASIDSYIKKIGGDYTSLYVRRGDKVDEMELMPLDDILAQTTIKDDGRTIFVQSDDYNVVKYMRSKFPSCKIITLTKENEMGSFNGDLINCTPEQRKEHTEHLLISCVISARASIGWSYNMSNVGNFIKMYGYDKINIYVDKDHSKEEVDKRYELGFKESMLT